MKESLRCPLHPGTQNHCLTQEWARHPGVPGQLGRDLIHIKQFFPMLLFPYLWNNSLNRGDRPKSEHLLVLSKAHCCRSCCANNQLAGLGWGVLWWMLFATEPQAPHPLNAEPRAPPPPLLSAEPQAPPPTLFLSPDTELWEQRPRFFITKLSQLSVNIC